MKHGFKVILTFEYAVFAAQDSDLTHIDYCYHAHICCVGLYNSFDHKGQVYDKSYILPLVRSVK